MTPRAETPPRPPDKQEKARVGGAGFKLREITTTSYLSTSCTTLGSETQHLPIHNPQAACRAIEAGLAYMPDACDMAAILRRRLDLPERIWLGASSLMALPADIAEQLSEAVLHDLRAGPPVPPFMSIRDAAMSWAAFASRSEHCNYLAAIWDKLPDNDRTRFIRRAL